MPRIERRMEIPRDGRLVIDLPPEHAAKIASVKIDVTSDVASPPEEKKEASPNGPRMLAVLAEIWREQESDPDWRPRSKEDIDRQVEEERNSWE